MKKYFLTIAVFLFIIIGCLFYFYYLNKNRVDGIVSESYVMNLIGVNPDNSHESTWIKVGDYEYICYGKFDYFKAVCAASQGTITTFSNENVSTGMSIFYDENGWSVQMYKYPFDTYEHKYRNIVSKGKYFRSFSNLGKSRNLQYLYFFPQSANGEGWLLLKLT